MKLLRENFVSIMIVVAGFVLVLCLYGRMPALVPTHWNASGVVDSWTPKPWGPLLLPMISTALLGLMILMRVISPKGWSIDRFSRTYAIITTSVIAMLFFVTLIASLAAIGTPIDMNVAIPAALGLLFIVLGNFMGKIRRNFLVGIRTPWTLASEEVWMRTHRLGGKLFVAAGCVSIAGALLDHGLAILLVSVTIVALATTVHSYWVYRNLERQTPTDE